LKPKQLAPNVVLHEGDHIIAVVPQRAAGPGWANAPTWVYVKGADGSLREHCIQPEERSPALTCLYAIGEATCAALLRSVVVKRAKAAK